MTRRYRAKGEKWEVQLSGETPHPGVTSVIFRCTSNSSVGWRVAEVPTRDYGDPARLEEADDQEVERLFERSQPFDYVHDPAAHPESLKDSIGR